MKLTSMSFAISVPVESTNLQGRWNFL